jgi:hypothetical protein
MSASNHQSAHHDQRRPRVKGRQENNESRSKLIRDGALTGTHGGGRGAATAAAVKWRRGPRNRVSGKGVVCAFVEGRWSDGGKRGRAGRLGREGGGRFMRVGLGKYENALVLHTILFFSFFSFSFIIRVQPFIFLQTRYKRRYSYMYDHSLL